MSKPTASAADILEEQKARAAAILEEQKRLYHQGIDKYVFKEVAENQLYFLRQLVSAVQYYLNVEVHRRRNELEEHENSEDFKDAISKGFGSVLHWQLTDDIDIAQKFPELAYQGFILSIYSVFERTLDSIRKFYVTPESLFDNRGRVEYVRDSLKAINNQGGIKNPDIFDAEEYKTIDTWKNVRDFIAHKGGYVESEEKEIQIKDKCKIEIDENGKLLLKADDCFQLIEYCYQFINEICKELNFEAIEAF